MCLARTPITGKQYGVVCFRLQVIQQHIFDSVHLILILVYSKISDSSLVCLNNGLLPILGQFNKGSGKRQSDLHFPLSFIVI